VQYPGETPSPVVQTFEHTFLFWGLIGEHSYELYDLCNKGRVYEIKTYTTMTQGFLAVVTLGIYTPRTITIVCSGKVSNRSSAFFSPKGKQKKPSFFDKMMAPPEEQRKVQPPSRSGRSFDEH
jgi:hypothetical protein